jgi:hypothetical protein
LKRKKVVTIIVTMYSMSTPFHRYTSAAERNWYNRNQETSSSGGNGYSGGRAGNGTFSQSAAAELAGTLSLLAATSNYYNNGHR